MKKKKGGHGAHADERWLLTYADMITLLVAFFIMLYSMSVLNLNKFQQVAISIRSGFGGQLDSAGHSIMSPSAREGLKPSVIPELDGDISVQLSSKIKDMAKKKKLEKELTVRNTQRGLVVSILTDKMLFPRGQANLTPQTERVLRDVVGIIKESPHQIRVEGHSDNLPLRSGRFPSNWELSTNRATTVVRYMIDRLGFDPSRLSAAGYADSRPLYPNDTEAHRAYNRRVDIVILKDDSLEPKAEALPPVKIKPKVTPVKITEETGVDSRETEADSDDSENGSQGPVH